MTTALTTLADVKTMLSIPTADTSEDGMLSLLITQVSALIETYLDRTIGQATYTEYYSGQNTPELILAQRPVQSIASIYEDNYAFYGDATNAFGTAALLTAGTDYALRHDQSDGSSLCGMVIRINRVWARPYMRLTADSLTVTPWRGYGNIKVAYTAGYASVPPDLELAANLVVAKVRVLFPYGQLIGSESYEERSISFVNLNRHTLLGEVQPLLAKYRSISFGR